MTNLQRCVDGLGSSLLNIRQDNLVSMETVCHRGSHDSDGKFKQVLVFRLDGPMGSENQNYVQLSCCQYIEYYYVVDCTNLHWYRHAIYLF